MKTAYILVGVPGSGKSTWAARRAQGSNILVVSTDMHVEEEAARQGTTYNSIFDSFMPTAVRYMVHDVNWAKENGMDIIWDQTSTTVASRAKKLVMLPEYRCIAVVFPTPDEQELDRRLASRENKFIPKDVIESMKKNFVMPTTDEGFTEVWIME